MTDTETKSCSSNTGTCKKSSCLFSSCILHSMTMIANLVLIGVMLYLYSEAQGSKDAHVALLFIIPPMLSIIALGKGGDKEEKALKKRIHKAKLRKELDELKQFDSNQ